MKQSTLVLLVLVLIWNASAAPFQNLGFDNANTNNVSQFGPYGPANEMLPSWQLFLGANSEPFVGLNVVAAGPGYSTLESPINPMGFPVDGLYSLALIPLYLGPDPSLFRPYTLIQNGDVPPGSLSVRFVNYGVPVDLYVNGSLVPLLYDYGPVVPDPNARLANVSGDISAFAGQNVELKFVTTFTTTTAYVNGLDNISFSAIPEPAIMAPLALGALLLFTARRAPSR